MKSMTGCGRGESARGGLKVTAELSSVNRKSSEISLLLPRGLEPLETQIRDLVNQRIARGRLTVRLTLHTGSRDAPGSRLDLVLAKAYAADFDRLGKALKLTGGWTLDTLLRAPGVMRTEAEEPDAETLWPVVRTALEAGLNALVKMRSREGAHLARDLAGRIRAVQGAVARIQRQAPQVQARYRENLVERIRLAGLEAVDANDERLQREVVLFADRSDISEELTRLQSHFQQFADCVASAEPVGRTLEFLSQEMNREINTVGSKAQDALISRDVVRVKTELEKFREQVQNVE